MNEKIERRLTGRIKTMSARANYGYIQRDDNFSDVFFHQDDCCFTPIKGTLVEFYLGEDRLGRTKAVNITEAKGRAEI